jgi:hypothetical protein
MTAWSLEVVGVVVAVVGVILAGVQIWVPVRPVSAALMSCSSVCLL